MAHKVRDLMRALALGESADGDFIVADVSGVQLVGRGSKKCVASLDTSEFSCVGLNTDGTLMAAASFKSVSLYTLPRFELRWQVASAFMDPRALCFVGDSLWHCARTGSERLDLKKGKQHEKVGPAGRLLDVSADGKWWLGYGKAQRTQSVGAAGKKRVEFVADVARFLPDGTVLAASGEKGRLEVSILGTDGKVVRHVSGPEVLGRAPLQHLTISKSGKRAALRCDEGFATIDVETLGIELVPAKQAQLAAWANDDQTLLMATTTFVTSPRPLRER